MSLRNCRWSHRHHILGPQSPDLGRFIACRNLLLSDFYVVAIAAAVLGFGRIAGAASGIAQILFFAFRILAILLLFFGRRSAL